jgi:sulfane dehydrogenase subunit SoxC
MDARDSTSKSAPILPSRLPLLAPYAVTLAGGTSAAQDTARTLGPPRSPYGQRSPHETSTRWFAPNPMPGSAASRTPLQDAVGIITPSALHFERHHAGVPALSPSTHELLVHGLVERPLVFTVADLRRMPSVSRIYFIECAGNSSREHEGRPAEDAQRSHGLLSCSEWTGVPLGALLREAGVRREAAWVVAEGADACRLARSLPIDKALDDVIVAYGQNGEALRPEQGYPLRLVVPGWEGNIHIKWLHRLQLSDQPAMSKDEAASYTDFMPDGRAQWFTFEMDVKSVITRPSGGQRLTATGFHEISGLAWSGRGRVARVEISVDRGSTWQDATLGEPSLPKAFTRFTFPWTWSGRDTWLQSRASDDTGDRQPTREELVAVRGLRAGPDGFNHYNGIKAWHVRPDGTVSHV